MGLYKRRQRKSLRTRKAVAAKRTYTPPRAKRTYEPMNTVVGMNPQSMLIHRGIGLPDKFRTKLVFCDNIGFGNFSPITLSRAYNLASPYDPDPALGGQQPNYFDQLSAIYERCNVVGSKITAKFAVPDNQDVVGNGPYHVGVVTRQDSSSLPTSDSALVATMPNCSSDLMTAQQTKTVVATYKPGFMRADSVNESSTSGTPSPYYAIVWASPQGTAITGSINCLVMIEYIVDFYNLKAVYDV